MNYEHNITGNKLNMGKVEVSDNHLKNDRDDTADEEQKSGCQLVKKFN
jgi:hypothetical protein